MARRGDDPRPEEADRFQGRVSVPGLEDVLGMRLPVLDDGFVRAVDYLGGDESIVQAARVSYGRGTRRIHEDRGLIRFLMRHHHTTPFEMCEIKLHVRVPMDTWRQWIRHRTANVNEYSTRYSVAIDQAQATSPLDWRLQASTNRQGSAGTLSEEVGKRLSAEERDLQVLARQVYERRLEHGVAREQARKDLPLSTYTEAYWKVDLWNLFHFLRLRLAPEAQQEIRSYAEVIAHEIVAKWVPASWEAFLDYEVNSLVLSAPEQRVLSALIAGDHAAARTVAEGLGWLNRDTETGELSRNREREEFIAKIESRLLLRVQWN